LLSGPTLRLTMMTEGFICRTGLAAEVVVVGVGAEKGGGIGAWSWVGDRIPSRARRT
jgi:hypothetical protein